MLQNISRADGFFSADLFALPACENTHKNKYNVYKTISKNEVFRFTLSPEKAKIKHSAKDYYLTWTSKGSLYILYPQIGNRIYLFNEKGEFLWELKESRYVQLFNDENWIMAVSGDHSRAGFLSYSFEEQIAHEGFLLNSYDLGIKGQYCLGFLGGSVYLGNLNKKTYDHFQLSRPLKKLRCNFTERILLTYSTDLKKNSDSINIYQWDEKSVQKKLSEINRISIKEIREFFVDKYSIELKEVNQNNVYPFPIPIHWNDHYGAALVSTDINEHNYRILLLFNEDGIIDVFSMNAFLKKGLDFSTWSIIPFKDSFVLYSDKVSLFINQYGIYSQIINNTNRLSTLDWKAKKDILTGYYSHSSADLNCDSHYRWQIKFDE